MKRSLIDKLKSWKRWQIIFGAIVPYVLEALTGELGWVQAVAASTGVILAGLGVLMKEDIEHIRAGASKVQADALLEQADALRALTPDEDP